MLWRGYECYRRQYGHSVVFDGYRYIYGVTLMEYASVLAKRGRSGISLGVVPKRNSFRAWP